jgi:RNA polymerase sigma-70 factor (ECF subfamily)
MTSQAGARRAFEAIVETHHAEIYRYLQVVVSRSTQAERLVEETFLRAFRGHRSLPAEADVRAWLFGIASTLCRTDVRSGRRPGSSAGGRGDTRRGAEPAG